MKRQPYYDQAELPFSIVRSMSAVNVPVTRRWICEAIGRRKSPHILGVIHNLAVEGWLTETYEHNKQGNPVYYHQLTDKGRDWIAANRQAELASLAKQEESEL